DSNDVETRIRRRQRPALAFASHVFLFADRPRNLGSESAGLSRYGYDGPTVAPDFVRGCRRTVVRRNGRPLGRIYELGPRQIWLKWVTLRDNEAMGHVRQERCN